MSFKPLNPVLYSRLKRFGEVKHSNDGEKFIARAVYSVEDEPMLEMEHDGEYYSVCCPFCRDTRYRLYVNHMFGQHDDHGRRMTFLALCYNENCLAKRDNQLDFLERVDDSGMLETVRILPGKVVPAIARIVDWPGFCIPLENLPDRHHAIAYLKSRNFDPGFLSRRYQVQYCETSLYTFARDRLVFPVFEDGKLKGWQCRHIGELAWKGPNKKKGLPPKYFSAPGSQFRSRCILNWDRMKLWKTGVIVEGPTDVYRYGPMSGCIFGNTITPLQRRKLLSVFRKTDRTLVMLLDPEEAKSKSTLRSIATFEKELPGRFCAVWLPGGTDPGSLDQDFTRAYVRDEAAKRGVKVVYERVLV